ncbi:MAG: hypothetical protein GY751_18485 [Bacteroidetes bacterium]|nr:hypothetical protein [Bacteroidota bacterium]
MATKMIFLCSCGAVFDIGDSEGVQNHLDARQDHMIHESTVHQSTQSDTLVIVQDRLVLRIRAQRDGARLEQQVFAEYPPGSGKMWRCGQQSQSDWSSLVSLDQRGLVVYPFRVYTFDERSFHDLVDATDLTSAVGTVSLAVLTERALAQSYIDAVLAATDEDEAEDAAAPYLAL